MTVRELKTLLEEEGDDTHICLTVPKVDQGRMEIAFVFNDQHGVVNLVAGQRADEIAADMALVIKDLAKDLALVIKEVK